VARAAAIAQARLLQCNQGGVLPLLVKEAFQVGLERLDVEPKPVGSCADCHLLMVDLVNRLEEVPFLKWRDSLPDWSLSELPGETAEHRVGRGFATYSQFLVELLQEPTVGFRITRLRDRLN
jgi:hypothetical protein